MAVCPQCGQENPEGARFCNACAAPLDAQPEADRETRKTVTVLFCDVAGYTEAGERLDPEALRRLQSRFFDDARAALERHGATVEKFIGDAVMAVFGIPQLHEDDALRAVRAALELQEAVSQLGLEARIGINTGEVVAGSGDALVTGDAVNVAARLEQAAEPGVILIGEPTHRLLSGAVTSEPAGPLAAKGKTEPLQAWRLLNVRPEAEALPRRLDSPMVGRERERAVLRQAFDRAREERSCHLFTVLGAAGVGKSRLVAELVREVEGEATVLRGRCLSYGEGITFWPLTEVMTELGVGDRDTLEGLIAGETDAPLIADRVAAAIGLGGIAASGEETFWAVRKLFEALARRGSLVLVFDDLHWAEPTFLDLVEHVADWCRDAPILLVGLARPELLDVRPAWAGGKLNATSVLLEPLPDDQCDELIVNLLGSTELSDDTRLRISEAAEGNPLFVEEMLAMLIDEGVLRPQNGGWTAVEDVGTVSVPPSIQALLAARLDRLESLERQVIERASVEGKIFHRGAVAQLSPEPARATVIAQLQALVRKELIRPDTPTFAGDDAFRFRHLLIRDAAYDSLPKETRADLHERYADWLEEQVADRLSEYEEILGYHLEQAYRCRAELGPIDEEGRGLGTRAASRLAAAGQRAFGRTDMPAAANLLDRAAALVPPEDPLRAELLPKLADALFNTGELAQGEALLRDGIDLGRRTGDRRLEARARLQLVSSRLSTRPDEVAMEDALAEAEHAIEAFAELGDESGLARAWHFVGQLRTWLGGSAAAEEAWSHAAAHARNAGDRRQECQSLGWLALSISWGPAPAEEGLERCREILERVTDDRIAEALAIMAMSELGGMVGRIDEGRQWCARGRQILHDLGARNIWAGTGTTAGMMELIGGEPEEAERSLRPSFEVLEEIGERGVLSSAASLLAEALYRQGRLEEAEHFTHVSEDAAAPDDFDPQVRWRGVRAKILAARGEVAEAERLARDGVARAEAIDWLWVHGTALTDLADVLRTAGRPDEAVPLVEEAVRLHEQKQNVSSATKARALLAELTA